jgi:hypothetical protein
MRTITKMMAGSLAGSLGCLIASGTELLGYTPWGDPQAVNIGMYLGVAAIVLMAWPVGVLVLWAAREFHRELRTLGLSAQQARTVELGALAVADVAWFESNRKESARLTESVMGPEREDYSQWPSHP